MRTDLCSPRVSEMSLSAKLYEAVQGMSSAARTAA